MIETAVLWLLKTIAAPTVGLSSVFVIAFIPEFLREVIAALRRPKTHLVTLTLTGDGYPVDPATGLLRLLFDHGIFYEFVPVDELGSERPTRHWLHLWRLLPCNGCCLHAALPGPWYRQLGGLSGRGRTLDPG